MQEIALTLLIGIVVAIVSNVVGHVLAVRRERLLQDCDDETTESPA